MYKLTTIITSYERLNDRWSTWAGGRVPRRRRVPCAGSVSLRLVQQSESHLIGVLSATPALQLFVQPNTALLADVIWRSLRHVPANSQKSRRAARELLKKHDNLSSYS